MIGDKIKYICKNCGWEISIRAEWGDLRPKRCMNRKCNTSFRKYPESLIIQYPDNLQIQDRTDKKVEKSRKRKKKSSEASNNVEKE